MSANLIVALIIVALVAIAVAKVAYDLRVGKSCDYCGGSCESCGACKCGNVTIEDGEDTGERKE